MRISIAVFSFKKQKFSKVDKALFEVLDIPTLVVKRVDKISQVIRKLDPSTAKDPPNRVGVKKSRLKRHSIDMVWKLKEQLATDQVVTGSSRFLLKSPLGTFGAEKGKFFPTKSRSET
ncbi:hypothetical protein TNCV_4110621 [Trichonephila clavipes]|nr:hypothetical protein TNCV_4110621 [Trichonephila clavipes]